MPREKAAPEPPAPDHAPALMPLESLPKPKLPEVAPQAAPQRRLPSPELKTTVTEESLDRFWRERRNHALSGERSVAVWNSTRSYTDSEAGHVVARFHAVTVTRKDVEDLHERVWGVRLSDLDLTPDQARQQIERIVGSLLLPEVELAEAESRDYAVLPGLQMETWLGAVVTGDEIRDYYEKNQEAFRGRTVAESWRQIEDLLVESHFSEQRRELKENLQEIRDTVRLEKHYEVLQQRDAPESAVLFSVNGRPYTMKQWRAELASLRAPPKSVSECERYADTLIDRILLLSSTDGIRNDGLRKRLETQRRANLRRLLRHEEVHAKIKLTDDERRQHYEQLKPNLTMVGKMEVGWLEMTFTPNEKEAETARNRLLKLRAEVETAKGFDAVVDKCVEDRSGGFRAVKRGQWFSLSASPLLGDGLPGSVRVLGKGDTSPPLVYAANGKGYLFHVYEKRPSRPLTFEEASPFVEGELWDAKHQQRSREFEEELLRHPDIAYNQATVADMVSRVARPSYTSVREDGKSLGKAKN